MIEFDKPWSVQSIGRMSLSMKHGVILYAMAVKMQVGEPMIVGMEVKGVFRACTEREREERWMGTIVGKVDR